MIENYHTAFLHEFAAEIMKRAQDGWKLDMTPVFMPKRHGSAFTCRFVKEESEIKQAVEETLNGLNDAGVYNDVKPSWSTFGQELIESCEQMNEIIAGEREPSRLFDIPTDRSNRTRSEHLIDEVLENAANKAEERILNRIKKKQELDEMEFTALQEYGRLLGVKDRSRSQLIKKILKAQEDKTNESN